MGRLLLLREVQGLGAVDLANALLQQARRQSESLQRLRFRRYGYRLYR
jgi:hypothetical protein